MAVEFCLVPAFSDSWLGFLQSWPCIWCCGCRGGIIEPLLMALGEEGQPGEDDMPQVGFLVFFSSIKVESIYSNELHFCLNAGVPADWIHSWKFSNVEGWRLEVKDNREASEGSFCFRLKILVQHALHFHQFEEQVHRNGLVKHLTSSLCWGALHLTGMQKSEV